MSSAARPGSGSVPPAPLTPGEVAALLRGLGGAISAEVGGLSPGVATWHPDEGEWCALEVMGHLIEAERRGFAGRILQILEHDEPKLQGWNQALVAQSREDCKRSPADVAAEFSRLREASVTLVGALRPEDLTRGGIHPKVGRLTIRELLQEWVHHDRNHFRQLLANVEAYAWPHMGNAQRFSEA
jgi:hypothetical protein